MRGISRRSLTIATAAALTFSGITAPTTFAADFGPKSTPNAQKTCNDKLLLDYGHIDIQMRLDENNDVDVKIKDETAIHGSPLEYRDLDDILVGIYDNALFEPVSYLKTEPYKFVGDQESPFYYLPLVQKPDILWPGYNTMGVDYDKFDGPIDLHLKPKNIPAGASYGLFTDGDWGAPGEVLVDSTKQDYTINTTYAAHVHSHWAFSHPGVYELEVSYSGTLKDGTKVSSEGDTLTFLIGDDAVNTCLNPALQEEPDAPEPDAPQPDKDKDRDDPQKNNAGSSTTAIAISAVAAVLLALAGTLAALGGPLRELAKQFNLPF